MTEREYEVLEMLCEGQTTEEIARSLFIGTETVKTHRKSILIKTDSLNVANACFKHGQYLINR